MKAPKKSESQTPTAVGRTPSAASKTVVPESTRVAAKAFCTVVDSKVTHLFRHARAAVGCSTLGKLRTFAEAAAFKSLCGVLFAKTGKALSQGG